MQGITYFNTNSNQGRVCKFRNITLLQNIAEITLAMNSAENV